MGIANDEIKQSILIGIFYTAKKLGIEMIAEGIETIEDFNYLKKLGIYLMQGYLFSKPGFETLPEPDFSFVK